MKRLLIFAMVLMLLALAVSSASADDGTIKGDIRINPNNVVIEPPQYPESMSNEQGGVTVEGGGKTVTVIINA